MALARARLASVAGGHGCRCARNGIGEIIIRDRRLKGRRIQICYIRDRLFGCACGHQLVKARQMRRTLKHGRAQRVYSIKLECHTQVIRQRAENFPVFARITRRKRGPLAHLRATFRVHVNGLFFGIGCGRQNHISTMRPTVAMTAYINHKCIAQFGAVYFICTVQNNCRNFA